MCSALGGDDKVEKAGMKKTGGRTVSGHGRARGGNKGLLKISGADRASQENDTITLERDVKGKASFLERHWGKAGRIAVTLLRTNAAMHEELILHAVVLESGSHERRRADKSEVIGIT